MDPKNLHGAASELFRKALDLPPEDRRDWLRNESGDQPTVLEEALSLLEHHHDDSFLTDKTHTDVVRGFPPARRLPKKFGDYRIQKMLGWGGSGVVYLAVQEQPRREVALKVLRADMNRSDALARFNREAETLARLDHPGITRIYEAGTADMPDGPQAFIAMEVVHGKPLAEYGKDLDHDRRLELAQQVAAIIAHAHSRGIVHRDLKPANILVRDDGQAVVLDFGIARHMIEGEEGQNDWTELAGNTVTGQLLGTLAYMSPEQAKGDVNNIDKRTDVYALGVLVYQLVSGKLPHDTRDKLITEVIRIIERGECTPISHYSKQFSGDLETIIEKSLRTEPARRYAHAGELADDLTRLTEHRPILARPPSRFYRGVKFLQRHRRLSIAAAMIVVVLLTALLASLSSLQVANDAEQRLRAEHVLTVRFADALLIDKLKSEVDRLWPAHPNTLTTYERWIAEAEQLVSRLPEHKQRLADADLNPISVKDRARLSGLVDKLSRFVGRDGDLPAVRKRREFAMKLEARTVDNHLDKWSHARQSISDSSLYGGLQLRPQIGLIPLGADPESGLWEFYLYDQAGEAPERDSRTGEWVITEETGIVFVLLPGTSFLFGAQKDDPTAPNYDPATRDHEGPPELVTLDAFFLSKYEWTQSQWLRVTGTNPSYYEGGDSVDHFVFDNRSPVESVNWNECVMVLNRLGLTLPTETQWEYGLRAGSSTIYWSGDDHASVLARSNMRSPDPGWIARNLRTHAPVGSFSPNPFGLHDMTGNVYEWCLDVFKVECRDWPLRDGDGLRLTPVGSERVRRGGAWISGNGVSRSARRDDQLEYLGNAGTGFRAARLIDE